MLNRTDVLKRMIGVRKSIYRKEMLLDSPPSLEDIKIRKELDDIIIDIIGDGFSKEDKEHIDNILLKAICDDITIDMAVVAIREIIMTYYSEYHKVGYNSSQAGSKGLGDKKSIAYYHKKYR